MTRPTDDTKPNAPPNPADEVETGNAGILSPNPKTRVSRPKDAKADTPSPSTDQDLPHAKTAETSLDPDKKHDHLVESKPEAKKDKHRQEA